MKIKTVLLLILALLLVGGAAYANSKIIDIGDELESSLDHDLQTLYGDENALDGVGLDLSYVAADSIEWDSALDFTGGEIREANRLRDYTESRYEMYGYGWDYRYQTPDEKVMQWVYDNFGIVNFSRRLGDKAYFYKADDFPKDFVYTETYYEGQEKTKPEKGKLPEGNGVYLMEYLSSPGAEYVKNPDKEGVRLLVKLGSDAEVKAMGFSKDEKYLEVIYSEGGRVCLKVVVLETEKEVASIDLMDAGDDDPMHVFLPGEIKVGSDDAAEADASELTLVAGSEGLVLVENKGGNFAKVVDRKFDEKDSFAALGDWLNKSDKRRNAIAYDGERLIMLSRIVKSDPLYDDHKGTLVMMYSGEDLKYSGIITSTLYRSEDKRLKDYFALTYENKYEEDQDYEWLDQDEYWSYFDIVGIRL